MKRKRELGMDEDEGEKVDAEKQEGGKRQKVEETAEEAEARHRLKAEKRKEKREKKKEKAAKLKEKREAKKAAKQDGEPEQKSKTEKPSKTANAEDDDNEDDDDEEDSDVEEPTEIGDDMDKMDMSGLVDEDTAASTAPSSPTIDSPAFDLSANHSTASSSSSIVPPSEQPTSALLRLSFLSLVVGSRLQISLSLLVLHLLALDDSLLAVLPLLLTLALRLLLALECFLEKRSVVSHALAMSALLRVQPEVFLGDVGALLCVVARNALLLCFRGCERAFDVLGAFALLHVYKVA